jgi:hypothetical protein
MMSRIDSRHWKFFTGRHFQNGHHNTAKIQHCEITSKWRHKIWHSDRSPLENQFCIFKLFKMSAKTRYKKWAVKIQHFPICLHLEVISQCWIFAVLWWPFWKWRPVKNFQCRESIRDIIIYPHIKFRWHRTMLNFYRPFSCRFGSHFENGRHLENFHYAELLI